VSRLILLALIFLSCSHGAEVRVFAAASLTDALTEIAGSWEQGGGEPVVFNFGSSATLARQIDAGAPADLFVSADEAKMDWLASRKRIAPATRVSLLSNTLVVVVPRGASTAISDVRDLASLDKIAIAEPSSVPAGIYARKHLERMSLWASLAPKVIPTDNVRSALHAVERGNAAAAIVYATDARISPGVRVAHVIENGPPISYAAALTTDAENAAAARRFLDYLRSEDGRAVFRRHGFVVHG
jgi:molybdate transport system substrate-binding protein